MTSTALPGDYGQSASKPEAGRIVRRRGSLAQGMALETLGHAVEYLVDQRMFSDGDRGGRDEQEAIQILMRLSREVFAECPEVVPFSRRVRRWLRPRSKGQVKVQGKPQPQASLSASVAGD